MDVKKDGVLKYNIFCTDSFHDAPMEDLMSIVDDTKKMYPKSKVWKKFMNDMFNKDGSYKADCWYDVIDNTDVGEILDWIIKFMEVHKKVFGE